MLLEFQKKVPSIPHKETANFQNSSQGAESKIVALITLRAHIFVVFKYLQSLILYSHAFVLLDYQVDCR